MEYQLPIKIEKVVAGKANIDKKIIAIAKVIAENDKSSHEFGHLQRVYRLASEIINDSKISITRENLTAICFLHDIGLCLHDDGGKIILGGGVPEDHAARGALYAKTILNAIGFPKTQIKPVENAISLHNNFKGSDNYMPAKDGLVLVLQDADRLDAIGAIGIFRYFRYAQAHNIPDYGKNIPLSKIKYGQKQNYSVIHNLASCSANIYKDLNFDVSKKIGKDSNVRKARIGRWK